MTQQKLILGLIKKTISKKYGKQAISVIFETYDFNKIVAKINFEDHTFTSSDASNDVESLISVIRDRVETELKKIGIIKSDYTILSLDFTTSSLNLIIYYTDKEDKKQFLNIKNVI